MMPRRKQIQPKRFKTSASDTSSDSGESDDDVNKESELKNPEADVEQGEDNSSEIPKNDSLDDESTDNTVIKEEISLESTDRISPLANVRSEAEDSVGEKKTKMTLKMETSPVGVKSEKTDGKEKRAGTPQGREKRAETPPLKRLMRQDPLPLFMHDKGPSPPKKIFREELYSKNHNVPYLSSAHASFLKHVPTHPKQAMLKAKHYSNKLLTPFIPFNVPKVVIEDQPLDLSKKTSSKSIPDRPKRDLSSDTKKSPGKYTNGFLSNTEQSGNSSLQNLQKRFGGEFPIKSHRHPMSGMLVNIPPSFLPKTHNAMHLPLPGLNSMSSESSKKATKPQTSPNLPANKSDKKADKTEASDSKRKSPHNTDLNSNLMSKSDDSTTVSSKEDSSKYTIHKCSCQKTYNTLYGLSLHLQETGHLPAGTKQASLMEYPKLVRGQDMWLNQESEQTKRILRCIQCGESFKSLPMLTVHMMQTQHYTKIVSSEHGRRAHKCSAYCDRDMDRECIFKCKVCNGAFNDMEGLANHMILSGHHKKNMVRTHSLMDINLRGKRKRFTSGDESLELPGTATLTSISEYKRKCLRDSASPLSNGHSRLSESPESDVQEDSRITCENCGERIETGQFVEHVRGCLLQSKYESPFTRLKMKREEDTDVEDDIEKFVKHREDLDDKSTASEEEERGERKPIKLKMKLERVEKDEKNRVDERLFNDDESNESTKRDDVNVKCETESTEEDESIEKEREEKVDAESEPKDIKTKTPTRKHLDIIDPDAVDESSADGNSALQAMESFIQRSFSSKFNYRRNSGRFLTQDQNSRNHAGHLNDRREHKRSSLSMIEKYQKYFGDICRQEVEAERASKNHTKSRDTDSPGKDDLEKLEKMCQNVKRSLTPEKTKEKQKPEINERPGSVKSDVSGEALSSKYLNIDDEKEESEEKVNSSSSALDSLSSFVYGQPLTSEHPLDSLQKLLTKSNIPQLSSTSLKCLPRISTPDASFPLNLSVKKETDDEADSIGKDSLSDHESNNSGSESDANAEYRCAACSRHFASKGSYRYHLSRCHLSSVKKYGIKEAFNMSPYIYLPLDHTAKFSKYYEMAHELANKGK